MPRPISATISLSSLCHNLRRVSRGLEEAALAMRRTRPKVWAVIKANAYGHGITNAVRAFAQADGLAMLDLDEAVRCRELGWTKPILLLEGFFEAGDLSTVREYGLSITLHSQEQLDMLSDASRGRPVNAYVKVNTGMNRLGFPVDDFPAAYRQAQGLQQQGILAAVGKMSHFARADDDPVKTREQLNLFMQVTQGLPGAVSVCNSAATLTDGLWAVLDDDQWVRPGICLYGSSPFAQTNAKDLGLEPVMTLASRIISVRSIPAGAGVGYGHTFTSSGPMRVGVVACGYADGYPRHAGTGTPITVNGEPTRLVGRVSMDMLAVDLSHIPSAGVGAPVVLWGDGGPSVDAVAESAGTIGYELLCALAARVPKIVIQDKQE